MERLTESQLNGWAAFLSIYPAGEDAQDARFMALRHDIYEMLDHLRYAIGIAGRCKNVTKPTRKEFSQFEIFKRFFPGKKSGGNKRDFRNLTQAEIAKRMTAAARALTSRGK